MLTTRALFETPNLDGLTIDPFVLKEAAAVLRTLSLYAAEKADAMQHRLNGNISLALVLEERLEERYAVLPEWARW